MVEIIPCCIYSFDAYYYVKYGKRCLEISH